MRPTSTERLTELRQGTAACRPELDDTLQYELVRQHGVTLRSRWFTIMMNSLTFCLVFKLHDFVRVLINRYPQDTLFRQIRGTQILRSLTGCKLFISVSASAKSQ